MGLGARALHILTHNPGKVAMTGFGAWSAQETYQTEREDGSSKIGAAAAAASDFVLPFMMGGWGYAAYQVATELPGAAVDIYNTEQNYARRLARSNANHAFQTATFNDIEGVHTMRQAGMSVAKRSKYNVQQAMLGNEAQYMMR